MPNNSLIRYMECPLCGNTFSYVETPITSEDQHIFIMCPHCKSDFIQPEADLVGVFDDSSLFEGAMTADVESNNILENLEEVYTSDKPIEK